MSLWIAKLGSFIDRLAEAYTLIGIVPLEKQACSKGVKNLK